MKYIKKYNEEKDLSIEDWCKKLHFGTYIINKNGAVDVDHNVEIDGRELDIIPIKFGIVNGSFVCDFNELKTLENSPLRIYGYSLSCIYNRLVTLRGCASTLQNFSCAFNKLTTLKGGPTEVSGNYNCKHNELISLEGYPKILEGAFHCLANPISTLFKVFKSYQKYKDSLDYNYLIGTDIIKLRFQEACEEAGVEMPESIVGYKYI